jgi:hypothetical protein
VALRLLRGGRLVVVGALAVAIQLLPLAAPLLLSTDAWAYWQYGEIAEAGENPYRDTPNEVPDNPAFDHAGFDWRDTISVYGPVFTVLSQGVAAWSGSSEHAAAWSFKVLAALALLALTWLAARLSPRPVFAAAFVGWNPLLAIHFAGGGHNDSLMMALVLGALALLALTWLAARLSPRPVFAAAFVGWNPLLAIHFAGGGHNDSLMMALVLGALALAAAGRRALAAVSWVLSIFVKWVPVVFFGLRAVYARAAGRPVSHLGFALTAAVVAAVATVLYGLDWLRAFGPLARNAGGQTSYAIPQRLEDLGLPHAVALGLATAVLVAGLAWLVREAHHGRVRLGRAACLLLLTTPWLTPWYTVWAVPLAAAEDDRTAQFAALAICAYVLPQTVPV